MRQSTKIHTQYQGLQLLFYRAALPLSHQTLTFAAGIIRRHRKAIGSRWRKLNPGQQALLVLAYLRKGETFAELAAGFGIGTTTAWRYVEETVALLAARAPKLRKAVHDAKKAGARVRRPGRHADPHRPGRRRPALLLGKEHWVVLTGRGSVVSGVCGVGLVLIGRDVEQNESIVIRRSRVGEMCEEILA